MFNPYIFLPQPRKIIWQGEGTILHGHLLIQLIAPQPLVLHFSAAQLQSAISTQCHLNLEIAAGSTIPDDQVGVSLCVDPQAISHPQGYLLVVRQKGVTVTGHDAAGVFYGVCTLIQMIEQGGARLPGLTIQDWPDFPERGVLLDVSRDKVYTMQTLLNLVDMLARWKVNQIQLYFEHTFAYRNHPEVWVNASPLTGQEILDLDLYCKERFISLVPNQNSFGHMQRWLTNPRYAHLAETHDNFMAPWGQMQGPFSLCPTDPGSLALIRDLYDELLPHFSNRMFNVGCDEAVDLGQGRSKSICAARGIGPVYLDYLLEIYREVSRRGFTMQYWGDIMIHYPDLIPLLPKDAITLEWGYEADHPFGPHAQVFAQVGVPFYLCPGTSAWNSIAGRTSNALDNLKSAAENGIAYAATGYLNTDWGDNGHWQPLPVSYLGLAMGAAYSWAYIANKELDVPNVVSQHAFKDSSGVMGKVAFDLGEIYKIFGVNNANSSVLFWLLQIPIESLRKHQRANLLNLKRALQSIDLAVAPLSDVKMTCADAGLIVREYRLAAKMLRHAAERGIWIAEEDADINKSGRNAALINDLDEITEEYRSIWLERNRPGGLTDSAGRFEIIRKDYQSLR